jgi:hypothetical protein
MSRVAIKTYAVTSAGFLSLVGLSGCFLSFLSPIPNMTTPADRARAISPKCASISEDKVASFASPSEIDSVEPGYSYVASTATNHEARLRGALVHLRPIEGVSKEKLARGLECHQARVILGSAPPFPDDPYVLPDRWLSLDVDSEGDGFAVQIRADKFPDARRVLDRAKLYVANRPREVVIDPAAPVPAGPPPAAVPPEATPVAPPVSGAPSDGPSAAVPPSDSAVR